MMKKIRSAVIIAESMCGFTRRIVEISTLVLQVATIETAADASRASGE